MKSQCFWGKAFVLLALVALFGACSKKQQAEDAQQFVKLAGRIDYGEQNSPVIIWQGSRIEFAVAGGSSVDLLFSRKSGQVYFDLLIDDKLELFIPQNGANRVALPANEDIQTVTLLKRNEASSGTIAFDGVQPGSGAKIVALPAKEKGLNFLFFGDSITAGACNEDGAEDQWIDMSTHNALKSYAAITADNFAAEYRNISISGMGISMGYAKSRFPETWDKLYPHSESPLADLQQFIPDFVFINLGENDDSWSKNRDIDFPKDYRERYMSMVKKMRLAYPKAHFVILRGGMSGGKKSERLIASWWKVVKALEENDSNISHYVFKHWQNHHPRVKDHQLMAAELTSWLKNKSGF